MRFVSGPLLALACSCAEPVVTLELHFPTEASFLLANTLVVDVYDGSGTGDKAPDAICGALANDSATPPAGLLPLKSSGNTNACAFLDGGVELPGVSAGVRVFFAQGIDLEGTPILQGCGQSEVKTEGGGVDVVLTPQPEFPENPAPACASAVAKCQENVPCAP